MSGHVTLILGGARSGKSTWAEARARAHAGPVVFIATAAAGDADMVARIAAHRAARPTTWSTVEAPTDLATTVLTNASPDALLLIDCLTLWTSNVLLAAIGAADPDTVPEATWRECDARLVDELDTAIAASRAAGASLLLVSNEVGMGLVPPYALGRRFRDALGRVNQRAAAMADEVVLMIAGLPIDLRRLIVATGTNAAAP